MYDRPRRLDFPIPRKKEITKVGTHRAVVYVPSTTDQSRKIPDKQFQKRIATIKDEQSFDAAKPDLDRVIAGWREVRLALQEFPVC